jgi:hypothetical protein
MNSSDIFCIRFKLLTGLCQSSHYIVLWIASEKVRDNKFQSQKLQDAISLPEEPFKSYETKVVIHLHIISQDSELMQVPLAIQVADYVENEVLMWKRIMCQSIWCSHMWTLRLWWLNTQNNCEVVRKYSVSKANNQRWKRSRNYRMSILCKNNYLYEPKDRTESQSCATSLNSMSNKTGSVYKRCRGTRSVYGEELRFGRSYYHTSRRKSFQKHDSSLCCVSVHPPLSTSEWLNQSLWNLVCISRHLSPSQWHTS